jgi:hypothetical protein
MAIQIDKDMIDLQVEIAKVYNERTSLNGKNVSLVLYDLIKKRCTFDKFITLLSQSKSEGSNDMLFTQQFFLTYILNNADTYLKTMILMACSYYMPLPLVSYQPKTDNNNPRKFKVKKNQKNAPEVERNLMDDNAPDVLKT